MDRVILEDMMVFVSIIVGMGCVTGIIVTYLKRRGRQAPAAELGGRLDQIADRLGHLDNAIETVAIEVERISEAQRFTAKVLADRGTPAELPPKRAITPH